MASRPMLVVAEDPHKSVSRKKYEQNKCRPIMCNKVSLASTRS